MQISEGNPGHAPPQEAPASSRCLICAHRHDGRQFGYSTIDHGGSAETLDKDHPAAFDNLEGHVESTRRSGRHPPGHGSRSQVFDRVDQIRPVSFFLPGSVDAASDASLRHIFFRIYCGWSSTIHSKKRCVTY